MNCVLNLNREFTIIKLLDSIWNQVMSRRFLRYKTTLGFQSRQASFTLCAMERLRVSAQFCHAYKVDISTQEIAPVIQDYKQLFLVDLHRRICTCTDFQDNNIICGHAFAFICALARQKNQTHLPDMIVKHLHYMSTTFSIQTWIDTYSGSNMTPIDTQNLVATLQTRFQLHHTKMFLVGQGKSVSLNNTGENTDARTWWN